MNEIKIGFWSSLIIANVYLAAGYTYGFIFWMLVVLFYYILNTLFLWK